MGIFFILDFVGRVEGVGVVCVRVGRFVLGGVLGEGDSCGCLERCEVLGC